MDAAEREQERQDARVRQVLNGRLQAASSATATLVLGVALLVLSVLPWLQDDVDRPGTSAWDLPGYDGVAVLALVVAAGLGSVVVGRGPALSRGPYRFLAALAFLAAAAVVWVSITALLDVDVWTRPALWLSLLAALALGVEHLRQAGRL